MKKTMKGIGMVLLAIGVIKMLPDFVRYMKIRAM